MANNMDYEPKYSYQDDLDGDPDARDPFIDEIEDDPTITFGIPPEDYRDELDDLAIDEESPENEHSFEDARSWLEDLDEDGGDESKAA